MKFLHHISPQMHCRTIMPRLERARFTRQIALYGCVLSSTLPDGGSALFHPTSPTSHAGKLQNDSAFAGDRPNKREDAPLMPKTIDLYSNFPSRIVDFVLGNNSHGFANTSVSISNYTGTVYQVGLQYCWCQHKLTRIVAHSEPQQ